MVRMIGIIVLGAVLMLAACNKYRYHVRETPTPPAPKQVHSLGVGAFGGQWSAVSGQRSAFER